ncbi:MAG TPA: hypothetical protein VK493_17275 [Bryobacteraceae bacterium]|nr:hypothetical protein [Bryobacteraceae bacterium]
MSTELQIQANRENAKSSSGPKSEAGKAVAALNNTRHGLAGAFRVLPTESQSDFDELLAVLREEHNPATFTETTLVEAMAQHHWLRRRALSLESSCYDPATGAIHDEKQLALYLRYQTTHERGFHTALNDLLKLKAARRKDQIGFESQQRAAEKHEREKELHKWDILLAEAKVDGQQLHDLNRDIKDSERLRVFTKSMNAIAASPAAKRCLVDTV